MRRLCFTLWLCVLLAMATTAVAADRLMVEVWTDRGEGGLYRAGDSLLLFYRVSEDGYVWLFNVNAAGEIQEVFPNRWDRENSSVGGHMYAVPARGGYQFVAGAPFGTEYVYALASSVPAGPERESFIEWLKGGETSLPPVGLSFARTALRVGPRPGEPPSET